MSLFLKFVKINFFIVLIFFPFDDVGNSENLNSSVLISPVALAIPIQNAHLANVESKDELIEDRLN